MLFACTHMNSTTHIVHMPTQTPQHTHKHSTHMHSHTSTRTCTHTHALTHAQHTQALAHAHTHMHSHTSTRTCTHTHALTHAQHTQRTMALCDSVAYMVPKIMVSMATGAQHCHHTYCHIDTFHAFCGAQRILGSILKSIRSQSHHDICNQSNQCTMSQETRKLPDSQDTCYLLLQ